MYFKIIQNLIEMLDNASRCCWCCYFYSPLLFLLLLFDCAAAAAIVVAATVNLFFIKTRLDTRLNSRVLLGRG